MYNIIDNYHEKYKKQLKKLFPSGFYDVLLNSTLPYKHKQKVFEGVEEKVGALTKLYKEMVLTLDSLAKKKVLNSYVEDIATREGIDLSLLHKTYGPLGKKIMKKIRRSVDLPKGALDYYSKFGEISLEVLNELDSSTHTFDSILDQVLKLGNYPTDYKERLELKFDSNLYHTANYDAENNNATLELAVNRNNIPLLEASLIAHELGHCFSYLNWADVGINPFTDKSKFEREMEAHKTEQKFVETLSKKQQKLVSTYAVLQYIDGLFEYEVFTNPNQNFSVVYANVLKEFWWHSDETDMEINPFYVANEFFFYEPGLSMMYPAIYTKYATEGVT